MPTRKKTGGKSSTKTKPKRAAKPRKTKPRPEVEEAIEIIFDTTDESKISPPPPLPVKPKIVERRRNARHTVVDLVGTFLFSTDAKVIDLSLDGMSLETNAYLQVGRSYSLKLDNKKIDFPLRGVVQWCSLKRTAPDDKGNILAVYRAGIKFDNIFADKAKLLLEFLEENAVFTLEEQIRGRFKIPKGQSTGVSGTADISVTTISLSGMSIECPVPIPIDDTVELDLHLGESSLVVSGRIASSQEIQSDESETLHHIGVEFVGQTSKSRRTLESFLQKSSKD